MGMDVYGKNPTSPHGGYFRRSVWGWHPLAELCAELAPELCAGCRHWHSNDGDGLDEEAAVLLARRLGELIEDGTVARYVALRNAALAALPDERCRLCDGTGIRTDATGKAAGMHTKLIANPGHPRHGQTGTCNGCDGRGTHRPFATNYDVDVNDVREFAAFLAACGGFEIC